MHRESIYVCTYTSEDVERTAYVSAWDDREAAELLAREIELEGGGTAVSAAEIRVRPTRGGASAPSSRVAAAPGQPQ